ncbi:hypothetical protein C2E21_2347 [Chlorella sorokiniana]|uniref:Uncharacterized protein n=1 Tax=Chlorella sorokiniana TaxID=3076 RepID=A0A2P6TY45_CHLSO|nr:hypothetical protein C2E21_2347 [Chlorella sorokiniana]|eukprot:PRW58986.1 hypothetical protein C2E21_2347 [Chlorella sorokiniana]
MTDQLAEARIELHGCRAELQAAKQQLAALQAAAGSAQVEARPDGQDLISDLALAEEKIEAADQQLAADESEEAASGRDLRVLRQQLSAMRIALVEARARLAEQEARLTSCPADAGEAGKKQALLLELQGCREDVAQLGEVQRRAAELAEENRQLQARAAKAPGTCPPAPPCVCEPGVHVTRVPDSPRASRRTELLQNQLLADALAEVQQLEEDNEKLRAQLTALSLEASSYSELRASLAAAHNRSAELSQELARCTGSLQVAQQQGTELRTERDELKTSLATSKGHLTTCTNRNHALAQSQKKLQEEKAEAERLLQQGDAGIAARLEAAAEEAEQRLAAAADEHATALAAAEARHAAAAEQAQQRLAATEAALAAVEKEKAEVANDKKAAESAASKAEVARRDAEVARATAEAELRAVREGKEKEIERLERLLAAQEEAARELRLAEQMRREAETGWLPLWAQRRWRAACEAAAARLAALRHGAAQSYQAASQRIAASAQSSWAAAEAAVGGLLGPPVNAVQQAASQAWEQHLRPLLNRRVRNWPEFEAAIREAPSEAAQRAEAAAASAQRSAITAKAAADAALLRQLARVPQLRPLARPEVASAAVWAAVAAVTVPLAWALTLATLRWLLFRLRPGRVAVVPPGSSSAWARLEAALGYQWEQDATRRAAVDGDSRGGTGRFAWLGDRLAQLLAAEAAFKLQPEDAAPDALAAAAAGLAAELAVGAKARAAGLTRLVQLGPGLESLRLAEAKERELYAACLGAAFADAGRHGFSKALLAHVAAEPRALRCRSALCLHFSSPQVEQQYQAWLAPAQLWTDILSSLLIVAAMLIVALRPPFQLWHNAPGTLALGAGMLAPLAFTLLSGPRYAAWRDSFMALFRLYAIVFACTAGIPAIAVPLPPERVHHWGPFWRLSGAESLLASALGFLLRQSLHVPVQAAALAVALSSLPTMCAQSFPDGCRATCLTRGALAAVGLGCAVPALLLHVLEQRSRATFARLLRETAADC